MLSACGGSDDGTPSFQGNTDRVNINFVSSAVVAAPGRFSYTPLSNTYGAASGQTGSWNVIDVGTSELLNTLGKTGSITAVATGLGAENVTTPPSSEDENLLNFYLRDDASQATLTLSGLSKGRYDLYYYSASDETGATANGVAILLTGLPVPLPTPIALASDGENWTSVTVDVGTDGMLSIVNISGFLSAIQLMPIN